jgi:hypothetical protein
MREFPSHVADAAELLPSAYRDVVDSFNETRKFRSYKALVGIKAYQLFWRQS